jgi:alkanesulfonate monooxygenase SsuD/methylene tetrahydromethanopterin reductase-like flavin-dependent oxidoreductase (luciferase family)
MKVSEQLPTHRVEHFEELASADAITELSREAEAAGFDAVFVTEHPFPEDRWLATGGHHAPDPFVCLTVAAVATATIRLQTNLCIPAYRNPFMLAKTVATLDALAGGRVIDNIRVLAAAGVKYACVTVPGDTRAELLAGMDVFATDVLPAVASV